MDCRKFIKELRDNVITPQLKKGIINRMISKRKTAKREIPIMEENIKRYERHISEGNRVDYYSEIIRKRKADILLYKRKIVKYEQDIDYLRSLEIETFVCLKHSGEYYYDECLMYLHALGDATIREGKRSRKYDRYKTTIWNFVAILSNDVELLTDNYENNEETN